jgi:hypothetical protein
MKYFEEAFSRKGGDFRPEATFSATSKAVPLPAPQGCLQRLALFLGLENGVAYHRVTETGFIASWCQTTVGAVGVGPRSILTS